MRVNTNLVKFNLVKSLANRLKTQLECDEVATLGKIVFSLVGVHMSVGGK